MSEQESELETQLLILGIPSVRGKEFSYPSGGRVEAGFGICNTCVDKLNDN